MLQIDEFVYAADMADAYQTLVSVPGSAILGGCGYLRLGSRKINTAIDLTRLGLDYIRKTDYGVEIGAMTTLRQLETDPLTTELYSGILADAVKDIVGVQLRNGVTLGGTVAGRYPFSDPITALVALDARVHLYKQGEVSLERYLDDKPGKDIVEKVVLPDDGRSAAFTSIRKARTDYAVLNTAVSRSGEEFRVVVGSRPGRAARAKKAEQYLNDNGLTEKSCREAGLLAAELKFGDNPRGSGEYRKAVCPVLVQRVLAEVMHAA